MRCLPLLLLAACAGGPDAGSLVPELRVMAIIPALPELAPGESTPASVRVLDPKGDGADVWVWTCSPFDGACLGDPPPPEPIAIGDGRVATTLSTDPGLVAVATEAPQPLVLAWALACAPGLCDGFFDDAGAMADPISRMKDVPLAGTSIGTWAIPVSTRAERHQNPALTGPVDVNDLVFTVAPDGGEAWGYTTAGGFADGSVRPEAGSFTLTWVAPEDPPEDAPPTELFVLYLDEQGGVATWDGQID